MRTIKFRGKRLDNGEWVQGDLIHHFSESSGYRCVGTFINVFIDVPRAERFEEHEVHPNSVGQLTDETDKNDKEVWENDIILIHFKGRRIVIWSKEYSAFMYENADKTDIGRLKTPTLFRKDAFEVIGNMTDGPDLLNG